MSEVNRNATTTDQSSKTTPSLFADAIALAIGAVFGGTSGSSTPTTPSGKKGGRRKD